MTDLALSWRLSGNNHNSKSLTTDDSCIFCQKPIYLNYAHKMNCGHTFCAFCCGLSTNQCNICGLAGLPQLKYYDNTSNSKLPD